MQTKNKVALITISHQYKIKLINNIMLANETHPAYLVNVLCRGEEDRRFREVTHGVKFRPFCWWVIQLIYLLSSSSRHLTLSSSSFFITCLPFCTLQQEPPVPWSLCSNFLTNLVQKSAIIIKIYTDYNNA